MKSILKFAYAAVLTLVALSVTSNVASAQSATRGAFTLAHDVHWQNVVVPAGEYSFSVTNSEQLLQLRSTEGKGGFLLLIPSTGQAKSSATNQLVLVSRAGESFVSALELPEFGTKLYFNVPSESAEKQVVQARTVAAVLPSR